MAKAFHKTVLATVRSLAIGTALAAGGVVLVVGSIAVQADRAEDSVEVTLANRQEAMKWLDRLKQKIDQSGPQRAAALLRKSGSRYAKANVVLAINRVDGDKIFLEAHSMYQLVDGIDVTDRVDSQGRRFSQNLLHAARSGGATATVTNRLSNASETPVTMQCYAEWAPNYEGKYFVVACYGSDSTS